MELLFDQPHLGVVNLKTLYFVWDFTNKEWEEFTIQSGDNWRKAMVSVQNYKCNMLSCGISSLGGTPQLPWLKRKLSWSRLV